MFKEPYNLGTTCWGPLDGGMLTTKYLGGKIPKDSRMDSKGHDILAPWFAHYFKLTNDAKCAKVAELVKVKTCFATSLRPCVPLLS